MELDEMKWRGEKLDEVRRWKKSDEENEGRMKSDEMKWRWGSHMKRSEGGLTQINGMKINEVGDECDQAEVNGSGWM